MDLMFACPTCGRHVTVDSSRGDSKLKCPGCGVAFPVPRLVSQRPPPPPASKPPPVPSAWQPQPGNRFSVRKETNVLPVMAWALAAFGLILIVLFAVKIVIPNFKAAREQAKRQVREQGDKAGSQPRPEIIQPTQAEAESVKIQYADFAWRSYETAGGDVLIVTCPIDNPTSHKLVNMALHVRCFDFADNLAVEKTLAKLTDLGIDFAPPNQVRDHELMVELGSVPAASITKVEVKIGSFQCTQMTELDTRLTEVLNQLRKFKPEERERVAPEQAAAFKEFLRLLEEKRKLAEP